jgi:hypothetical protein
MGNGLTFTTSIPFYVGNQQMPAGSYKVTTPISGSDLLLIQDSDRTHSAFIPCNPTQTLAPANQGLASFNEYGDVAFLNTLTVTGETYGVELQPGNREKEMASTQGEQASAYKVPLEVTGAGN